MARRRKILNQNSPGGTHGASADKCSCGGSCSKCSTRGAQARQAAAGLVTHRFSEVPVYSRATATGRVQGQKPGPGAKKAAPKKRTPKEMIDDARPQALLRALRATWRVRGVVPPGPEIAPDAEAVAQEEARDLAKKMFKEDDPDMDKVGNIVEKIRDKLLEGNFKAEQAKANDKDCGNRAGYVRGNKYPIVLCPPFFSGTDEERVRTLIHEAAHVSGIGEPSGESYCVVYDCETPCGDANSADSWAQFIHCLGGGTADKPDEYKAGKKGDKAKDKKPQQPAKKKETTAK